MSYPDDVYSKNTLLNALSPDDLALFGPHLSRVDIAREDILVHANAPIEHVFFLDQGVASIVAAVGFNRPTEVGIFGRDGVSATCLLLGSDRSPHQTFIQIGSGTAMRIDTAAYRNAVRSSETLRMTLLRFVQAMLVQAAHSTATNAHHRIEARLARWLLMCHDRTDREDLPLTHELLSLMLGVRRAGVTTALRNLSDAGAVRTRRGGIGICDRSQMLAIAGDAYGGPEAEYQRVLG